MECQGAHCMFDYYICGRRQKWQFEWMKSRVMNEGGTDRVSEWKRRRRGWEGRSEWKYGIGMGEWMKWRTKEEVEERCMNEKRREIWNVIIQELPIGELLVLCWMF